MANETKLKYELMNLKYELTNNIQFLSPSNRVLHQIRALKDFDGVKKGDLGGWVESEGNLSQEGNCWIYDNAKVYDSSRISNDAKIYDNVIVHGSSIVTNHSSIRNDTKIRDSSIFRNVTIEDRATILASTITGNVKISGKCAILNSKVYDDVVISGKISLSKGTRVRDNSKIYGSGSIRNSHIYENAKIKGCDFYISNGDIKNSRDFISFSGGVVYNDTCSISNVTVYRSQYNDVIIRIENHDPSKLEYKEHIYKNTAYAFKKDLKINSLLTNIGKSLVYDAISYVEGC